MNNKILLKIARQIYRIAADLPLLSLPKTIEKEALDCYYDFVNNDGQNGKDDYIINFGKKIQIKKYIIQNIKSKANHWYKYDLIKDRFNDKIIICYYNKTFIQESPYTDYNHNIIVPINNDTSDVANIKHELQHYFQHLVIDEWKLDQYIQQMKKISNLQQYLLSQGQRIQQIGTCCQRFFDLYMKSYYQESSFQQFYYNFIENKLQVDLEKLQSKRFENYCKNSLLFLSLIKNKDEKEYEEIRKHIINYANQSLLQRQNLQTVLNSKNYSLIQNLIMNNKTDKKFIDDTIQILLSNKKFKLLTVILQHYNIYNLLDFNQLTNLQLFNITKNTKDIKNKVDVMDYVLNSKNAQLIKLFMFNLQDLKLSQNIYDEYLIKFKNWIYN